MGKHLIIPVALLLILFLFSGFYIGYGRGIIDRTPIKLSCPAPNITISETKCPDCILYSQQCENDKPNSVVIAENLVKEMNYTGDYNCDEFSWELVRRYNNAGYDAHYCEGYVNYRYCQAENCKHAIVRLDKVFIEATTGKIITPQEFAEKYVNRFCIGD